MSKKAVIKSWAEFTSDLLNDAIEGEDDFIQWPGKNVTEAIAEILTRCGYEVSAPVDVSFKGWELDITKGKCKFTARVTLIYKYSIVVWQNRFFKKRVWPEFLEITEALARELAKDPRFHNIQWFTDEEYEPDEARTPHQA